MPDIPKRSRCFRLLGWAFFFLALVVLGIYLDSLPPKPRGTITLLNGSRLYFLSPAGTTLIVGPEGPFKYWKPENLPFPTRKIEKEEFFAGRLFYLVNLNTFQQVPLNFIKHSFCQGSVAFSPEENFAFMGMESLRETETGEEVAFFEGITNFHGFGPGESLIIFEKRSGPDRFPKLHVWDIQLQKDIKSFQEITAAALSPDGRLLAASNSQGLFILDLKNGNSRSYPFNPGLGGEKLLFSPDARTLAIYRPLEQKLVFWNVAQGKQRPGEVHQFQAQGLIKSFHFSADSNRFVLIDQEGIFVWDVGSGASVLKKENFLKKEARYLPETDLLIVHNQQTGYDVLEAHTGRRRHLLPQGDFCEFSQDYRFMVSCQEITPQPAFLETILGSWWPFQSPGKLKQVRIFDVASGVEQARWESDSLRDAWLSLNGSTLVTSHQVGDQFFLRCWDVPLQRPWPLIIGIPLGIGLTVISLLCWRNWRRKPTV